MHATAAGSSAEPDLHRAVGLRERPRLVPMLLPSSDRSLHGQVAGGQVVR